MLTCEKDAELTPYVEANVVLKALIGWAARLVNVVLMAARPALLLAVTTKLVTTEPACTSMTCTWLWLKLKVDAMLVRKSSLKASRVAGLEVSWV